MHRPAVPIYIYIYICSFHLCTPVLKQPRDSTFFQGMLVKSQFFGRKQTKSPNWNHSCFGISFGPGVLHIWISCPTTSCWCRQVGTDRPPTGMIPELSSFVQSVHRPRCQGDKGEISWRDVTYGAEAGCFGRRERIYREATGLQVCVSFFGAGWEQKVFWGKVWTFFWWFFWIGNSNCCVASCYLSFWTWHCDYVLCILMCFCKSIYHFSWIMDHPSFSATKTTFPAVWSP